MSDSTLASSKINEAVKFPSTAESEAHHYWYEVDEQLAIGEDHRHRR